MAQRWIGRVIRLFTVLLPILGSGCRTSAVTSHGAELRFPAWGQTAASRWISRDRQQFGYTAWLPPDTTTSPRAVCIAVHGLSGAASDFRPLGEQLAPLGMAVYAYDLRGQGNDPVEERRGDLQDSQLWLNDLADFTQLVQTRHPGAPLLYYGESMGSLIALHAAARPDTGNMLAGLILASPVVHLDNPLTWWQTTLLRILTVVRPTYRVALPDDAALPPLTRNVAYQKWLQQAPHLLDTFTLRLLRQIETLMRQSTEAAARLTMPVLVLHGGQDIFTASSRVETFFEAIGPRDKSRHLFPESYHLLLHDDDQEDVLTVIRAWLNRLVTVPPPARETSLERLDTA